MFSKMTYFWWIALQIFFSSCIACARGALSLYVYTQCIVIAKWQLHSRLFKAGRPQWWESCWRPCPQFCPDGHSPGRCRKPRWGWRLGTPPSGGKAIKYWKDSNRGSQRIKSASWQLPHFKAILRIFRVNYGSNVFNYKSILNHPWLNTLNLVLS